MTVTVRVVILVREREELGTVIKTIGSRSFMCGGQRLELGTVMSLRNQCTELELEGAGQWNYGPAANRYEPGPRPAAPAHRKPFDHTNYKL